MSNNIKKSIRTFYTRLIPESVRYKLRWIVVSIEDKEHGLFYWKKHKKSFGKENPNTIFYVLRAPREHGILSSYRLFLSNIYPVIDKNYKIVVDMKTLFMPVIHNSEEEKNNINVWENFFEQPDGYSIDEVYRSKNVIFAPGYLNKCGNEINLCNEAFLNNIKTWNKVALRYLRIKPSMLIEYEEEYKELIGNKRVIALTVRDEFNILNRKNEISINHMRQPSHFDVINDIEKYLLEWKCDYIFVSTEHENFIKELKKFFGNKILFTNRKRYNVGSTVEEFKENAKRFFKTYGRELITKEYLMEVYIMSKCTTLLSGISSAGEISAIWNNGKYEHMKFYDLGTFKNG